jgi:hypothetical protein
VRDACLTDAHNRLRSFSPIFPVSDLRRALAHYASLGFEVKPYANGDEYGFADRDEVGLHLSLSEEHGHHHTGTRTCTSKTPTHCTTSGRGRASAA